jgi:hypothetical protein
MVTFRTIKIIIVITSIASILLLISCISDSSVVSSEFQKTNTTDHTTTQTNQPEIGTTAIMPVRPSEFEVVGYEFTNDFVWVPDFTYAIATISGGNIGEYTLYILEDTVIDNNLVPLDPASEATFYHDGTITTVTTPFPDHPYPNDGNYIMKIFFGSDCQWIQPDDSSKLTLIHWGWNED